MDCARNRMPCVTDAECAWISSTTISVCVSRAGRARTATYRSTSAMTISAETTLRASTRCLHFVFVHHRLKTDENVFLSTKSNLRRNPLNLTEVNHDRSFTMNVQIESEELDNSLSSIIKQPK